MYVVYREEIISYALKISCVACTVSCVNILVTIPNMECFFAEGQISTSVHVFHDDRNY